MSKSEEDTSREGKIANEILGSILDSIPSDGLLVPNRMGMDAGIVRSSGDKTFCFSKVNFGWENNKSESIISEILNSASNLGKIILINPVVLVPPGTQIETIKQIITELAGSAVSHGIIVGKGHTEITSKVKTITLITTVLGSLKTE
jgi:hypothetical protein